MVPPHLLSQLSPCARCMTLGCFRERQRTTPVTCTTCKHLMAQHQWVFCNRGVQRYCIITELLCVCHGLRKHLTCTLSLSITPFATWTWVGVCSTAVTLQGEETSMLSLNS